MIAVSLLLAAFCTAIVAYPQGPPEVDLVCIDMKPNATAHGGDPQTVAAPFTWSADVSSVGVGREVHVNVTAPNGTLISGLLLMARLQSAAGGFDTHPVGFFRLTAVLRDACYSSPYSALYGGKAISHAQVLDLPNVNFTWVANNVPKNTKVTFFSTVVQDGPVYWVKQQGPTVFVSSASLASISFAAALVNILAVVFAIGQH